jgi:hypothetical protein
LAGGCRAQYRRDARRRSRRPEFLLPRQDLLPIDDRARNEINALAAADDGVHQISPAEAIIGDQPDRAVNLWTLMSGAACDLVAGFLDEHLDPLADPCCRALTD